MEEKQLKRVGQKMDTKKLSMLELCKKCFIQYVPASLQPPLRRFFVRPLKWLVRSIMKDIWLPIYRLEQPGLSVILIGHHACDSYLIRLLYAEYLAPRRIGTVPIWSLGRVIQHWEEYADVVIFRDGRFRPWGAVARRMLKMPYYVAAFFDLPPSAADLQVFWHNSKTRSDLKKIQGAEFQYEITREPAVLNFFYHEMHRPLILDRHSDTSDILPWEEFRQAYGDMELLLVRKAGLPVAGCLNLVTGDCYALHVLGVLNADKELFKAGAGAACYWFSIVEAQRRGCTTVNMQCSRPFLKDGVLEYKKKWISRIVMDSREREFWLLPCGNGQSIHRFLEQNPFICEQDGWLGSLIFLGSHVVLNDKDLSSYLREYHFHGDRLSTYVVLLNNEWAVRAEIIQNVLSELPSPNHILDLSQGSVTEIPKLISNWKNLIHGYSTKFSELACSR